MNPKIISLEFDPEQLKIIREIPLGVAIIAFRLFAEEVQGGFKDESPIDYGKLANWQLRRDDDFEYALYGAPHYALYVALGTGIYGEHKQRIYPKVANVLHWVTKGGKHVFAKSTEGQRPNPYHKRAWDRATRRLEEFVRKAQREFKSG